MMPREFRQSRRARPVPGYGSHRSVCQFGSGSGCAKHQSAAAHIAAPDEVGGKHQVLTEYLEERSHILSGRDAAQQNEETIRTRVPPDELSIALQWIAEIGIAVIDRHT